MRDRPQPESIEPSTPTRVGVGSVRRPWGTDGAISVSQFSDDEQRFHPGDTVYLQGGRAAKVMESHRSGTSTVLLLDIVRNVRAASDLRGTVIEMERADIPEAPEGSFYHYEIIGAKVRNKDGEDLGQILDIIVTGANDVYVVGKRGPSGTPGSPESPESPESRGASEPAGEILIPAIADVILDIDVNNGVVTVDLPEGLR
ncbi:MAG: ribosome maturation factor RimM [Chloroflexi bacterium]|nr:ribosome maturation factor RimM [Chloroflexota bacterium]